MTDPPEAGHGSVGAFLSHLHALERSGDTQALLGELETERMDRGVPLKGAVARSLGKVGDPAALAALIRLVSHDSLDVRIQAVKALGSVGDARAVGALGAALADPVEMVEWWAVLSLKDIGGPDAVRALLGALPSPYVDVRREAVLATRVLSRRADVSEILYRALEDCDRSVYRASLRRLLRLGDFRASQPLTAFSQRPVPLIDRLVARCALRLARRRSPDVSNAT